jgi:PAS domain S-box-containing protein
VDDANLISERLSGIDDLKSLLVGLFVHAPISFQIYSADGHSLAVNPTFLKLFGSAPPPEYNVFVDDILERQGVTGLIRRAFAGETIVLPPIWYDPRELRQVEVRVGRRVGVQVTMFPLRDGAGVVRHVALCAQDVTPQLELGMREESLRLAFSAGRMIAWDTNLTARTVHVSDNAREVLGLGPETPLVTIDDTLALVHAEDRAAVAHALAVAHDGGGSPDRRFRVVRPLDGELRWFERRGQVSLDATTGSRWLRGILIDVTARVEAEGALRASEEALRRAEEQLRQSQKIEAIGRLAGGIAHDFNNILSVILSYGDLLLADLPADDARRPDVTAIRRAGERAAELTTQLLAFSRQQVMSLRVLDLNDAVRSAEQMMRRLLGETIELVVRPAARETSIRADAGQLDQVIMNLAINARDAMPEGGKLTIETAHVVLDEAYAREHLGVAPGPHVMLAVSDTGHGMDREVQARVFEPFFTTKERGKGTGLGLSTVLGIVQQTGGSIWLYSEPVQGTTFKVFFPRATPDVEPLPPAAAPATLRGSETVLLVEDQEEVRRVAREILSRYGYHVVEAASAQEALGAWDRPARPFDLLLTDVVMPAMSGRELADRLVAARPGLRVLFMSGYTEDAILHHRILESGFAYLQKPLVPETLARKVREVLDAPAPGRGRS